MRIHPLLSGFGAVLIAFAPVHALAQTPTQTPIQAPERSVSVRDRPHPDYDPLGLRFGSFNVNASLALEAASTDNLFAASSSAAVDDVIYAETAVVRLASDWSRHALVVEGGATSTQHNDFSNEDSNTHYLRAVGRLDVGHSTNINASARVAHQVTPRTDPDSPLVGSPVEYDRTDASVGVEHRFARFRVSADAGHSTYDYDGAQSFRDNNQTIMQGRLDFEVSSRIGLVVQATADNRDYDNTPGLSSDGRTYLAGVSVNGDLMRGELSVGHFERNFDDPSLGTFDGLAVAGNLEWYVTDLTTITLDVRRDASAEISATAGLPYVTTELGVRADHELLRNVILSAEYRRGKREYDSIDRNDDFSQFGVGADYMLNRRVALRLRFEHFDNDSSGAMAYHDYNVNTGTVGISLRL